MSEIIEKDIIDITWSKRPYLGSIIFLLFVVILTASLYGYNYYLKQGNIELQSKIEQYDKTITEVEKDPSFKIYSLIDTNKEVIKKLTERSKIVNYINHIEEISKKYGIQFRWFNLWSWKINTSVLIESTEDSLAYKKLVSFIKDYRSNNKALFKLWFINQVTWYDSIKITIDFDIK